MSACDHLLSSLSIVWSLLQMVGVQAINKHCGVKQIDVCGDVVLVHTSLSCCAIRYCCLLYHSLGQGDNKSGILFQLLSRCVQRLDACRIFCLMVARGAILLVATLERCNRLRLCRDLREPLAKRGMQTLDLAEA